MSNYTPNQYSIYALGFAAGEKLAQIFATEQKFKQSLWVANLHNWVEFRTSCPLRDRGYDIQAGVNYYDVETTYHAAGLALAQM